MHLLILKFLRIGPLESKINVWLGNGSSLTKTVFLVVTGEDGSKHVLFIYINA